MIVDPPDRIVRDIERRLNGKYFSNAVSLAMGPDGSMAVLCSELGGDQCQSELDLFSPTGDPIQTIVLPRARQRFLAVALDGRRAVIAAKEEALIVDVTTGYERRLKNVAPLAARADLGHIGNSRGSSVT